MLKCEKFMGKITENVHFALFVFKNCLYQKNEKNLFSFSHKIKYILKFHAFTIKNDFRNMSHLKLDFTGTRLAYIVATSICNNQTGINLIEAWRSGAQTFFYADQIFLGL